MENIDVKGALKAAQQIKSTRDALHAQRTEHMQEKLKLHQEIVEIYRQPLRAEDVKALILFTIDAWSDEFLSSWKPVLRDFAYPRGARPRTVSAFERDRSQAERALNQAREHLSSLQRMCQPPSDLREEERPHWRAPVSQEALATARGHVHTAERDLQVMQSRMAVSMTASTFEPNGEPLSMQDAVAIFGGQHDRIFGSAEVPYIDPMRNIFAGALDASMAIDGRANQALSVKGACFFFGDVLKAKVEAHFGDAVTTDAASEKGLLTMKQCRDTIDGHEDRIAALGQQIDAIDAQLKQLAAS